jgi:putative membrane protein
MSLNYGYLPAINATLNGTSAVLLLAGRYFIAKKRIAQHRACMLTALATSAAFLGCYLYYHFIYLPTQLHIHSVRFPGHGIWRTIYLTILGTHTVLAIALVPLILVTLTRALKSRFPQHRTIARWTYPIWLYVSVTGVVVYLMLYKIFAA